MNTVILNAVKIVNIGAGLEAISFSFRDQEIIICLESQNAVYLQEVVRGRGGSTSIYPPILLPADKVISLCLGCLRNLKDDEVGVFGNLKNTTHPFQKRDFVSLITFLNKKISEVA